MVSVISSGHHCTNIGMITWAYKCSFFTIILLISVTKNGTFINILNTPKHPDVCVSRPRKEVDLAIVLRMRDEHNLGWTRMAEAYSELTGQYISRDTMKRRYYEGRVKHI